MNIFYNYLVISSHNFDNNSTYTFCCADHNFTGRSTSYAKWTMLGFELNGTNIKTCGLLTTSSNFSVNTTTTSDTFPNKFRKLNEIIALGLVRASNSNSLNNSLLQKEIGNQTDLKEKVEETREFLRRLRWLGKSSFIIWSTFFTQIRTNYLQLLEFHWMSTANVSKNQLQLQNRCFM